MSFILIVVNFHIKFLFIISPVIEEQYYSWFNNQKAHLATGSLTLNGSGAFIPEVYLL